MMDCDGSSPVGLPGFPHRVGTCTAGKTRDSVNLRLEGHLGSASHYQFDCYKFIFGDSPCSCETVAKLSSQVCEKNCGVTHEAPSLIA